MVKVKKDLTGRKFNLLTVVMQTGDYINPKGRHFARWLCRCECGNEVSVNGGDIVSNHTKSCGCRKVAQLTKRATTHGLSKHPLYSIWMGMKKRCYNSNTIHYRDYGGRGIVVCSEWLNNPKIFIKWGIENGYKAELQIDRRDNDKGYSPENCRFVTSLVNNLNQRVREDNTSMYVGINAYKEGWRARIADSHKRIHLGVFPTKMLALKARNAYIEAHGLIHKLQIYKGE